MNYTETEARRLLAVGTEDMPPGIDVLPGFVAARRRDRARRTRGRAVLSAGAAVAAASVTAVALTFSSASPALAMVTSALARTLAQSYHLTVQDSYYYVSDGRITGRARVTCVSDVDPVRHLRAQSCTNGLIEREVGGFSYLFVAHDADHPGKHWMRMRMTGGSRVLSRVAINKFAVASPEQMLSEIEKAGKVTVIGPVSGPGWTGTRYAFASSPWVGIIVSGTVDVDQQGRTRNLSFTTRFTSGGLVIGQVLAFSSFGAPVTVTPPPADQTFSWR